MSFFIKNFHTLSWIVITPSYLFRNVAEKRAFGICRNFLDPISHEFFLSEKLTKIGKDALWEIMFILTWLQRQGDRQSPKYPIR